MEELQGSARRQSNGVAHTRWAQEDRRWRPLQRVYQSFDRLIEIGVFRGHLGGFLGGLRDGLGGGISYLYRVYGDS